MHTAKLLKHPTAIIMFFLALIILGIISVVRLPVELMPNADFLHMSVSIPIKGGASAREIESLVTIPTEHALSRVQHLKTIMSEVEEGASRTILLFEPDTNMDYAMLDVREHFSKIKDKLPSEADTPVIAKFEQNDMPVMVLGLTSDNLTCEDLRQIADDIIKPELSQISGVANINVVGGKEKKILIELNKYKVEAYNLSIDYILNKLGINNMNMPAGFVSQKDKNINIKSIGRFKDLEEIKNTVLIQDNKRLIRISDIAEVSEGYMKQKSIARISGADAVTVYIQKESSANTIFVAGGIEKRMEKIKLRISDDVNITTISNQSIFVKNAIKRVLTSLLYGAILASIILILFIHDGRAVFTIIICTPISILISFFFMHMYKISFNMMSLSGLTLGIGMLVDNSIVIIENILQHKRSYKNRGHSLTKKTKSFHSCNRNTNEKQRKVCPPKQLPESSIVKDSIIEGTNSVILPIFASTITSIIVFLPLLFVNKEMQILYGQMAWTFIVSLLVSLILAVTLLPVLFYKIQKTGGRIQNTGDRKQKAGERRHIGSKIQKRFISILRKLEKLYIKKLIFILRNPAKIIKQVSVAVIILLFMAFVYPKIGTNIQDMIEEENFTINVQLKPGTKFDLAKKIVTEIEDTVRNEKYVESFTSKIEGWRPEVTVHKLKFGYTPKLAIKKLRVKLEKYSDDAFIYFQEGSEAKGKELMVEIFGYDYDILKKYAQAVSEAFGKIPGLTDVKSSMVEGVPEYNIVVDKEKAAVHNMSIKNISSDLHAEMRGMRATKFYKDSKELEVVVRFKEEYRDTLKEVKELPLTIAGNNSIQLSQIADLKYDIGPGRILRKNKHRTMTVSATLDNVKLGDAIEKLKPLLKNIKFKNGCYYMFDEKYYSAVKSRRELILAGLVTILLIYMLLASMFESYIMPFIIMTSIPLAGIGVILMCLILKKDIALGTLIGFILLTGVVVNSGIVLVDTMNHLKKKGRSLMTAILSSCKMRFRPVLVTTMTTVLGLMPMCLDSGQTAQLWSNLALTVVSGIFVSFFLTLFVVPCSYFIIKKLEVRMEKLNG